MALRLFRLPDLFWIILVADWDSALIKPCSLAYDKLHSLPSLGQFPPAVRKSYNFKVRSDSVSWPLSTSLSIFATSKTKREDLAQGSAAADSSAQLRAFWAVWAWVFRHFQSCCRTQLPRKLTLTQNLTFELSVMDEAHPHATPITPTTAMTPW